MADIGEPIEGPAEEILPREVPVPAREPVRTPEREEELAPA